MIFTWSYFIIISNEFLSFRINIYVIAQFYSNLKVYVSELILMTKLTKKEIIGQKCSLLTLKLRPKIKTIKDLLFSSLLFIITKNGDEASN